MTETEPTPEPTLYDLAKKYVEAVEWSEEHPDDVYSGAGVELAQDLLTALVDNVNTGAEKFQVKLHSITVQKLNEDGTPVDVMRQVNAIQSPYRGFNLMDPDEFRTTGYLQEVNRQFFHPLGLALLMEVDESGEKATTFSGVVDAREDPEGFVFIAWADDAEEKAERVREGRAKHARKRASLMHGVNNGLALRGVQPVGWIPPPEDE